MATQKLSRAALVKTGYGQVELQKAAFQRTGELLAIYPAAQDVQILEQGQFVKLDAAKGTLTPNNTNTILGEYWMVYNEIKLYEPYQFEQDFAMIKTNYNSRVYSPIGQKDDTLKTVRDYSGEATKLHSNEPYKMEMPAYQYGVGMPEGTKMVPRVVKINIGDVYTTNTVDVTKESLQVGDVLVVDPRSGYLVLSDEKNSHSPAPGTVGTGDTVLEHSTAEGPKMQVEKIYTMPDHQPAVKLMRVM